VQRRKCESRGTNEIGPAEKDPDCRQTGSGIFHPEAEPKDLLNSFLTSDVVYFVLRRREPTEEKELQTADYKLRTAEAQWRGFKFTISYLPLDSVVR